MDNIYDFSECFVFPINDYDGRERKERIIYNGDNYLMKFRNNATGKTDLFSSQTNNIFSEYVGCHIIETLDIPVQKTLLGTYKGEVVVACKDFTFPGVHLAEFSDLSNSFISKSKLSPHPDLDSVLSCYEERFGAGPSDPLRKNFWDIFIIDSFIGNFDRHAGNWGFLVDDKIGSVKPSPIYDCGSCLYPALAEHALDEVMSNVTEIDARIYRFPSSSILYKGKKISYFDFISSLQNEECTSALLRVYPKISMDKISQVIDATPIISDTRKQFYKSMLSQRYTKILTFSYEKALSLNLGKSDTGSIPLKSSLSAQIHSAFARAADSHAFPDTPVKAPDPER